MLGRLISRFRGEPRYSWFVEAIPGEFSFLETNFGFELVEKTRTDSVKYDSPAVAVRVYRGPQSRRIGVTFWFKFPDEYRFDLDNLIGALGLEPQEASSVIVTGKRDAPAKLQALASLVRDHAAGVLRGDTSLRPVMEQRDRDYMASLGRRGKGAP